MAIIEMTLIIGATVKKGIIEKALIDTEYTEMEQNMMMKALIIWGVTKMDIIEKALTILVTTKKDIIEMVLMKKEYIEMEQNMTMKALIIGDTIKKLDITEKDMINMVIIRILKSMTNLLYQKRIEIF